MVLNKNLNIKLHYFYLIKWNPSALSAPSFPGGSAVSLASGWAKLKMIIIPPQIRTIHFPLQSVMSKWNNHVLHSATQAAPALHSNQHHPLLYLRSLLISTPMLKDTPGLAVKWQFCCNLRLYVFLPFHFSALNCYDGVMGIFKPGNFAAIYF